jgi:trigger factor
MSPEQYAQQLQSQGNIADFVADVRRTKALAQLLEQTTITDESGNVVDLEALRNQSAQTVRAASDPAAPEADAEVPEDEAEVADVEVAQAQAADAPAAPEAADTVVSAGEASVDEAVATEADAPGAAADKA